MQTVAGTVNRYVELLGSGTVRHGHHEIRELYNRIEKRNRTVELPALHINDNEAAFLARLTVIVGDSHTRIDGVDVMTFDDDGRITSMRAFWSVPGGR
jgi:steroid delta-isomerase